MFCNAMKTFSSAITEKETKRTRTKKNKKKHRLSFNVHFNTKNVTDLYHFYYLEPWYIINAKIKMP